MVTDVPPDAQSRAAMSGFLQVMHRRYACKLFDQKRPLDAGTVRFILECGRLSPSSFGLEHWHFHAVLSPDLRERFFHGAHVVAIHFAN